MTTTVENRLCEVEGCDGTASARGFCHAHYERKRLTGDVGADRPLLRRRDSLGRFWAKVNKDGPIPAADTLAAGLGPCWLWTASQHGKGYGSVFHHGRLLSAHRASFEIHGGVLILGMELDHLCKVRLCVNPDHLEQVTHAENVRRGDTGLFQRSKTHCPQQHPYDEENTYFFTTPRGYVGRSCRACKREKIRARRAARKVAPMLELVAA